MASELGFIPPFSALACLMEEYVSCSFRRALRLNGYLSNTDGLRTFSEHLTVVSASNQCVALSNGWSLIFAQGLDPPIQIGSFVFMRRHRISWTIWSQNHLLIARQSQGEGRSLLMVTHMEAFKPEDGSDRTSLMRFVCDFCLVISIVWFRSSSTTLSRVKGSGTNVLGVEEVNAMGGISAELLQQLYPPFELLSPHFIQRALIQVSACYSNLFYIAENCLCLQKEVAPLLRRFDVSSLGICSKWNFWQSLYLLEKLFIASKAMPKDWSPHDKIKTIYLSRQGATSSSADEAKRLLSDFGEKAVRMIVKGWVREKGFSRGPRDEVQTNSLPQEAATRISRATGRKREQSDNSANTEALRLALAAAAEQTLSFARNPSTASALASIAKDAHLFASFKHFVQSLDSRLPNEDDHSQVRTTIITIASDLLKKSLLRFGATDLLVGSKRLRDLE